MPGEPFSPATPANLSRREAFRRILLVSALVASRNLMSFAAEGVPGIGVDPNLLTKEIPWPRILSEAEKAIVTALADIIIPADDLGPAASSVGVPDFIDEWVSAPYEQQVRERAVIQKGLVWMDEEILAQIREGIRDGLHGTAALDRRRYHQGRHRRSQAGPRILPALPRSRGGWILHDTSGVAGDRVHGQYPAGGVRRAA